MEILTIGKQQPGVPRGRPTNKERALRAAAKGDTVDVAAAAHLQTRAQVLWNLHQLCPRASIIYVYHGPGWNHVASRLFKLAGIRRVDSKSPFFIDAMNWCCACQRPVSFLIRPRVATCPLLACPYRTRMYGTLRLSKCKYDAPARIDLGLPDWGLVTSRLSLFTLLQLPGFDEVLRGSIFV